MMDKLLDAKQTSELLALPLSKIRALTRHNEIPHFKIGHYCRYDQVKLEKWLDGLERGLNDD